MVTKIFCDKCGKETKRDFQIWLLEDTDDDGIVKSFCLKCYQKMEKLINQKEK